MKLSAFFLALALSAATANASFEHGAHHDLAARHASFPRRAPTKPLASGPNKRRRCQVRPSSSSAPAVAAVKTPAPSSSSKKPAATKEAAKSDDTPKSNNNGGGGGGSDNAGSGKMVWRDSCGGSRPSAQTTHVSGPNGHIEWLNCGVTSGGWTPPFLTVNDLAYKPLSNALSSPGSPYHACKDFIHIFEQVGAENNIPPTMLAAFAMQESSCNPHTVGGGGEQGLMQITHEKCVGAPGGNCQDPWFNISTAARYFATTLKNNGGNILVSIGAYNGWPVGLTYERATRARYSSCCLCQNNLDYLHQFVNGWLQNINAYDRSLRLGKHFNLDVCG